MRPIGYLARCLRCNHHVYASDYVLYEGKLVRIQGSARTLKTKMAEHMSKSHNESYGLFASTISLTDFSECFAISRFRGRDARTLTLQAQSKNFWYVVRNQTKLLQMRMRT